ncbi:hypothetical protein SCANM63S_08026 [Streptomyces canarius]
MQGVGDASLLLVPSGSFRFDLPALGDVPYGHEHHGFLFVLEGADADLDGELTPVDVRPVQVPVQDDRLRIAPSQVGAQQCTVPPAPRGGHQVGDPGADEVVRPVADESFHLCVGHDDGAVPVRDQGGVGCGFQQRAEPLVGPLDLALGRDAFGDVDDHTAVGVGPVGRIGEREHRGEDVPGAYRQRQTLLSLYGGARRRAEVVGAHMACQVDRQDVLGAPAQDVFVRQAGVLLESGVDRQEAAVQVPDEHRRGRVDHECLERFVLPHPPFGPGVCQFDSAAHGQGDEDDRGEDGHVPPHQQRRTQPSPVQPGVRTGQDGPAQQQRNDQVGGDQRRPSGLMMPAFISSPARPSSGRTRNAAMPTSTRASAVGRAK